MSKGSKRRPAAIDRAEEEANWARTFGAQQPDPARRVDPPPDDRPPGT